MIIGTSSLIITCIKQLQKNIFNGKQETALKTPRITPHLWKLQYNRNRQDGTSEESFMNCYVFCLLCVVHCSDHY